MKKLFFLAVAILSIAFKDSNDIISKKERHFAAKFLKDSENDLLNKVNGLSEAQLTYKPGADRWSVEDCLKHIAITEQALWQMEAGSLKQPASPEKRSEIKVTDQQLISMIEDRTRKVKTQDSFKPENTPFKSKDDAIASFKENREKLIGFVKSTQDDLRDHVETLPFGSIDAYQGILFIGAHTNRHLQQIAEVMADPGFPKK